MHRPMMKSDAIKILSLENKEVTPEQIIGVLLWILYFNSDIMNNSLKMILNREALFIYNLLSIMQNWS